jgi:hypothetical protein
MRRAGDVRGYGTIKSASVSWPENPFTEPSQYIAQVHAVVLPSELGVQTMTSDPSPLAPVTLKAPSVLI